ncbi:MAG: hypothetical protein J5I93_05010 [Pirellulaceae bacterium]|nr:hypothetical protein [Pirellulaceae bacterium]
MKLIKEVQEEFSNQYGNEWDGRRREHLPLSFAILEETLPASHDDPQHLPAVEQAHRRYLDSQRKDKTLFLVMGYSPEQIVLSMAVHVCCFQCRRIIPVTTHDVWASTHNGADIQPWWDDFLASRPQQAQELSWDRLVSAEDCVQVSERSPSDVFKHLRRRMRALVKRQQLDPLGFAVDATGGTKPMDSGAAAFAAYYDLPAYYIASGEYNSDLRRPDPTTAIYQLLDRPLATFSHANRQSLWRAVQACDFPLAAELQKEIDEAIGQAGEFAGYFEEVDRRNSQSLGLLIDASRTWLRDGYYDQTTLLGGLADGLAGETVAPSRIVGYLQSATKGAEADQATPTPRELVRRMREETSHGNWRLVMENFVAEYYRLRCLAKLDLGEDPEDTSQSAPPENPREILTVGYGLAESIIDSLWYLPRCRQALRVSRVSGLPWDELGDEERQTMGKLGWSRPNLEFFRMKYKEKLLLLVHFDPPRETPTGNQHEAVEFKDVWCRKDLNGDRLTGEMRLNVLNADGNLPAIDRDPPDQEQNAYILAVTMTMQDRSLNRVYAARCRSKSNFGNCLGVFFGKSSWGDLRHMITHVRVPVTDGMRKVSAEVMYHYLPRLIELYRRIAEVEVDEFGSEVLAPGASPRLPVDLDLAMEPGWLRWRGDPEWAPDKFAPWLMVSESAIRKWLGLEF